MPAAVAATGWRLLALDQPLLPQVQELAEEDPEMFGLDVEDDDDQDTDDTPMTAAEAKVARLRGGHRLAPTIPGRPTAAERNAEALGALRERHARPRTAPVTAQKAADVLTRGVGRSADR
ncbi:hypothetical protein [Streptomyces virginiae]|nr:hypothetical protein [Streptomyces virginiae]MBP2343808.1 hypothetical protein [Streptomyces virginiae]